MINPKNIFAVFCKEIIEAFRNKTIFFALAVPVILSVIFSLAFSGKDAKDFKVVCISNNNSNFYNFLKNAKIYNLTKGESPGAVEKLIKSEKFDAGLIIPENFQKKIKTMQSASIFLYSSCDTSKNLLIENSLREALRLYCGQELPVEIKKVSVYAGENEKLNSARGRIIPIWILFTLLGGISLASSTLIEEKDRKTLLLLLVSPAKISEIVLGKASSTFLLVVIASVLILFLNSCFSGNISALLLFIVFSAFCFTQMGIMIGIYSKNQTVSNAVTSLMYIIFILPPVLSEASLNMNKISKFLPSFYMLDGINKTMLNGGLFFLRTNLAVIAFTALILMFANSFTLKKELGGF